MKRVMILARQDDWEMDYLEAELEKMRLTIDKGEHSMDFLEKFARSYAQLVVLDVDLLGERLGQLVRILRSLNSEVKLLLVLSPNNLKYCSEVISMGGVNYFIKPVSMKNLVQIVQSFLQSKKEEL